jgi:hypothetical protein
VAPVFGPCRFHFGTLDSSAKSGGAGLISQLDMFTSGWIGSAANFNLNSVCTDTNPGGALAGKVPALVAYIISFTGRGKPGWCLSDCNANNATCTPASDLCTKGADYIRQNMTSDILPRYATFAQGFAKACGTTRPIIWEMEPDFYQYHASAQGGNPLTVQEAAMYMSQMIAEVRKYLPNAVFSMDISPWMPMNGATWYPNFNMSDFTFISTSGGNTAGNNTLVRASNSMTWAGVHMVTGKPILADTGYGSPQGPDPNWDMPANINARIADGVVSITQYSPTVSTWGATLSAARSQLNPTSCY